MTCQPKGSMCMGCSNGSAACGQRDFGSMPVIQVYPDGVKAVKCTGHAAQSRAEGDLPAALRASEEAWAVWWQAQQPAPARRCIQCGAGAPSHLKEGESPPCGCL